MSYSKPDGFIGEPTVEVLRDPQERDPFALMLGSMAVGIERARHAADMLAESYRRFEVGSTGFAYNKHTNETAMITAANYKLRLNEDEIDEYDVDDIPKFCAEMGVVQAAEEAGYTRMLGLIVAGTTNPKKIYAVSFRETDTLHPCSDCRGIFHHSTVVDDNTQILTVGSSKNRFQSQSYRQLRNRYRRPAAKFEDAPPAARIKSLEWLRRYGYYLEKRESQGLTPADQYKGDISRNRERILIARTAMSTELTIV